MPDLNIETYTWCEQNEYANIKVGDYIVTYRAGELTSAEGWHCTCKGFMYRHKCKHIEKAKELKCDHGWEAAIGSPATDWVDDKCPKCGGPTSVLRVGV